MQVKNLLASPTTVAGVSFLANETKTVDDSYMENLEFISAISTHTLSVVKFQKQTESLTFYAVVDGAYTAPSIDQKGALVAGHNLSPANPVVAKSDINWVGIVQISDTEFYCKDGYSGAEATLNTLSSNEYLIDGTSTGNPLPVSSVAYICLSTDGQFRFSRALLDTQVALFEIDSSSKIITADSSPRVPYYLEGTSIKIAILKPSLVALTFSGTVEIDGEEYTNIYKKWYSTAGIKTITFEASHTVCVSVFPI